MINNKIEKSRGQNTEQPYNATKWIFLIYFRFHEFEEKKIGFCLVEVCVSLLTACYLFVFHFFRLAWKMNYWGGGVCVWRKVNKTHLYCTLAAMRARVQVSWDFNLLIKIRHLKTSFWSSFSWCLWTRKLIREERLIFQKRSVESSAWRMQEMILPHSGMPWVYAQ